MPIRKPKKRLWTKDKDEKQKKAGVVYKIPCSQCKKVYVVVNFLFQLIFIFPLFLGMVIYANEFKTKEKQKLTEIKN